MCELEELSGRLARLGDAGLRNEFRCVGGFVPTRAGGVEAFEELLGVSVNMVKCCFESKDVCTIAWRYSLSGCLEDRVARRDGGAVQQDGLGRRAQTLGVGVAQEGVGLCEERASAHTVLVDLFDARVGHWFATLARSPTSDVVGASMTRRVKLERSASKRRNLSSARTVKSTLRPTLLPTGRMSRRSSRKSASPTTRTSMSLSGLRVPATQEPYIAAA